MDDIHLDPKTREVKIGPSFLAHLGKVVLFTLKMHENKIFQIETTSGMQETCGSVRTRSIRVAKHLRRMNLKVGDVVLLCAENHLDSCIPFIASQLIGTIPISLVVGMTHSECKHLIGLARPSIVFSDPVMVPTIEKVLNELNMNIDIVVYGNMNNFTPFSDLVQPIPSEDTFACVEFDPGTTISYAACSSGTTGYPKLVALTHLATVAGMGLIKKFFMDTKPKDDDNDGSQLIFSSLYWSSGIISVIISCLTGATRILSVKPFSPETTKNILDKYKPSSLFLSPVAVHAILKYPDVDKINFSSLKMISTGGSVTDADTIKSLKKYIPHGSVINGYGATEVGTISFGSSVPGSVGKIHPWIKWKVVDINTGEDLGPHKEGEIRFKGITLFKEYRNDPESTAAAFDSDGYYKTGDLVYYDTEGNIFIVDRIKEVIKYQNYQIATAELENLINTLPEVMTAAVVGVLDQVNGELPMAFVQKVEGVNITPEKIKQIIRENLSDYKQLRGGVVFLDKMPVTYSGKIDRKTLRTLKSTMKGE